MSGVHPETCEPLTPDSLLKSVKNFVNKYRKENGALVARVIAIFISYYDVPDKQFNDLVSKLGSESRYAQAL